MADQLNLQGKEWVRTHSSSLGSDELRSMEPLIDPVFAQWLLKHLGKEPSGPFADLLRKKAGSTV